MSHAAKVEFCAEALFNHRWPERAGGWDAMQLDHPDITLVYRDSAKAFLKALDTFESNEKALVKTG